jgi:Gamma-glutamyltranspeptidase
MQNRGTSFSLKKSALNRLAPGRLPFHTLSPALAILKDGRIMAYGTMGGFGQPQTQGAIFTRYGDRPTVRLRRDQSCPANALPAHRLIRKLGRAPSPPQE